jgi:hypothetical protein
VSISSPGESGKRVNWPETRCAGDAHDTFQREAILTLQRAVTDYWEAALDGNGHITAGVAPGTRTVVLPLNTIASRLSAARAQVFDDTLRYLTMELDQYVTTLCGPDAPKFAGPNAWSDGGEVLAAGNEVLLRVEDRVNILLKKLF